jgi:hypothetical protein
MAANNGRSHGAQVATTSQELAATRAGHKSSNNLDRAVIAVNHVITGHEQVQNKRLQRATWWHSGHTNIKDCREAVGMAMIIYISGLQSIG